MDRRTFLKSFAASLAAGAVSGAPVLAAGDSWKAEFAAALKRHPWLLGYKSSGPGDYELSDLRVEGVIPEGLRGTLYRNGPAQHEVGDTRHQHWFTGDGLVHAYRIHDGGASHFGRFVQTSKFVAETAAVIAPITAPGAPEPRITLTAARLTDAARVYVLITGAQKRVAMLSAYVESNVLVAPVGAILRRSTHAETHWAP